MKGFKRYLIVALVLLSAFVLLGIAGNTWSQAPAAAPTLTPNDCIKCHSGPPSDISTNGAGHKKVTCMDCHAGHRPASKNNIPQCNQCHMGKPHYELKGCLSCHRNPHTPLVITFAGNLTEPCLTCHTQQIGQLKEHKSKHTALTCTNCHGVHRKKPECTQCHKPHSAEMTSGDCRSCHKAHMPKNVMYASDIPSKSCGACHKTAFDLLTASEAKHKSFACAFCHQERHKMVPKCQDCHGSPHPAGIMAKFSKCGDCHNIAHNLNAWPAKAEKHEAPSKDTKKKK